MRDKSGEKLQSRGHLFKTRVTYTAMSTEHPIGQAAAAATAPVENTVGQAKCPSSRKCQDETMIANQISRIEIDEMIDDELTISFEVDDKDGEMEHSGLVNKDTTTNKTLLVPRSAIEFDHLIDQGGDPGPDKNTEHVNSELDELNADLPDEYFDQDSSYDSYFEEDYFCWEEDLI